MILIPFIKIRNSSDGEIVKIENEQVSFLMKMLVVHVSVRRRWVADDDRLKKMKR
jgi:hypothetical protein